VEVSHSRRVLISCRREREERREREGLAGLVVERHTHRKIERGANQYFAKLREPKRNTSQKQQQLRLPAAYISISTQGFFYSPSPPPFLNIYRVVGIVSSANERKSREADFLSFLFPSRKSNQTRHTQHTHTTQHTDNSKI
jgi:hypothetical protein